MKTIVHFKCKCVSAGKNGEDILVKGFWIWWCKTHKQPLAWCEKDELRKDNEQLQTKLNEIQIILTNHKE